MRFGGFMDIRKPAVAGKFYDSDPVKLEKAVNSYLKTVPGGKEKIYGVLVPHAGYAFSGSTAAAAFSYLKGLDYNTVVVISTGHTMRLKGAALVADGSFETPLGRVGVDAETASALLKASKIFENLPRAHEDEHAIEVELPFLQVLKGDAFKIVPVAVNTPDLKILTEAGRLIGAALKGKKALVCVSSDLSHYPPASIAEKSDRSLLLAFKTAVNTGEMAHFDLAARLLLEKAGAYMDTPACGQAAMTVGAAACLELGADDFKLLEYTHSGRVSGDLSGVVGYAGGLFVKSGSQGGAALSEDLKVELLKYARTSIENHLKNKKPESSLNGYIELNQPAAVFVTLTEDGRLRGCIGTMEAGSMLADAVTQFAVSSAFGDPRFNPLAPEELPRIKIEISVLSPLRKVECYKDIVEKKHGVYVQRGRSSGTYLPQVWEHFRTKEEFLTSLCLEKAGLEAGAWKEKSTALFVYTVDSFKEKQ